MSRPLLVHALAAALLLGAPALAFAQAAAPAGPPPAYKPPPKDPMAAPAGTYMVDTNHSSIEARINHFGYSYSTLRFGVTQATLDWNPANPAAIKLNVTVAAKPEVSPIQYRADLAGPAVFNVAMFPTITFISTSVKKTGPTTADVEGNLTLLGVTKPEVIHAELVGAGKSPQGKPTVGFTGTMKIMRSDFGLKFLLGPIGDEVNFVLDGEFLGG